MGISKLGFRERRPLFPAFLADVAGDHCGAHCTGEKGEGLVICRVEERERLW